MKGTMQRRGGAKKKKTTAELKVGDVIEVWWSPRRDRITALRPYPGPLLATLGKGTMLAEFALNNAGMTMEAGAMWEVVE